MLMTYRWFCWNSDDEWQMTFLSWRKTLYYMFWYYIISCFNTLLYFLLNDMFLYYVYIALHCIYVPVCACARKQVDCICACFSYLHKVLVTAHNPVLHFLGLEGNSATTTSCFVIHILNWIYVYFWTVRDKQHRCWGWSNMSTKHDVVQTRYDYSTLNCSCQN